jgi:hypothetical protein
MVSQTHIPTTTRVPILDYPAVSTRILMEVSKTKAVVVNDLTARLGLRY